MFKKQNVKIWQDAPTRLALYLAARGLVGDWRGSLIRHGSVLETVSYYVHTRILLRESCVIQTTVNSGDRCVLFPSI